MLRALFSNQAKIAFQLIMAIAKLNNRSAWFRQGIAEGMQLIL